MKKFSLPLLQFTQTQAASFLVIIMILRMFGLFVAIPVLSLHAGTLFDITAWNSNQPASDAYNGFLLGMVMGGYGLMQFLMQIPCGMLSDRWGRRLVIISGLIFFIAGSVICELARNVEWLAVGRLLQGVGAVSAATTALLADLTTPKNRVRWMAAMGVGISLAFITAFIFGPKLYAFLQFKGFFLVAAYLAVISMALLAFFPPNTLNRVEDGEAQASNAVPHWKAQLKSIVSHRELLPLNAGVFFLHASMVGVFVVVPGVLKDFLHLSADHQWEFYAWIVPASLFCALLYIFPTQRALRFNTSSQKEHTPLFTIPLMVLLLVISLWLMSLRFTLSQFMIVGMLGYFFAFNVLEALQPALVSFIAPSHSKGAAMGAYHACQSLGLFVGGLSSAWIYELFGTAAVFRWNASLMALWLTFALYSYFRLGEQIEKKTQT